MLKPINIFFYCLLVIAIIYLSKEALSQQYVPADPWVGQTHDKDDPNHWYPSGCCNESDCFILPEGAVEEVQGGWHVKWVSPNAGAIDEIVPYKEGQGQGKDGSYHGCWYRGSGDNKAYRRCFFFPGIS
jgi:hypothetical protein